MKQLDNIHTDRFYTDLVLNHQLIQEYAEGQNAEGEWFKYVCFEDAVNEAEWDEVTLNDHGTAYYFADGKVYQVLVYIENNEGTGVSELDKSEILELIEALWKEDEELGHTRDEFLAERQPWASTFVHESAEIEQIIVYEGNFGTLTLSVDGNGGATGSYQEDGCLTGTIENNLFQGTWKNKGMEGRIEFSLRDGVLEGGWKKGLEEGPMRGKWKGTLVQ